jgi:hypothetical protein
MINFVVKGAAINKKSAPYQRVEEYVELPAEFGGSFMQSLIVPLPR